MQRRAFAKTIGTALGAGMVLPPGYPNTATADRHATRLGEPTPVTPLADIHERIPTPVVVERIEVMRHPDSDNGDAYLVRVYDADGAYGTAFGNVRLPTVLTLFETIVAPFFLGRDARDLARGFEDFYYWDGERAYKYLGMPLWTCYGNLELACLDLLGKRADANVRELLGETLRTEIPVYASSLSRRTSPEEEVDFIAAQMERLGTRACKLKIGGRMSRDADASPGRTEALVPLARRRLGDDAVLYVDANGSYSAPRAIEVGRMLADHGVAVYEEPCEWPDFEGTRAVAEGLRHTGVTVAGGEQDSDLYKWRWMIERGAVGMVQPDLYYNGGLLRSVEVANLAAAAGLPCTTHNPRNDAGLAAAMAMAAVLPNLGPYQEYKARPSDVSIPATPKLACVGGVVRVPEGAGLGVSFDEAFVAEMPRVRVVGEG